MKLLKKSLIASILAVAVWWVLPGLPTIGATQLQPAAPAPQASSGLGASPSQLQPAIEVQ